MSDKQFRKLILGLILVFGFVILLHTFPDHGVGADRVGRFRVR